MSYILKLTKPKKAEQDARYMWLVDTIGWPHEGAFSMRPAIGYYTRVTKWTFRKFGFWIVVGRFFLPPKMWYYFKTEEDKVLFKRYLKTISRLKKQT